MPQAIVAAAVSAAASYFTGASLAMVGLKFVGSLVLGAVSQALTPKPKKPQSAAIQQSSVQSNTFALRQSDLTRQHVYGHTRITRGYAHMQSTGTNGTLHIILILCEGELTAINEVWVNDYAIPNDWIDSNGNVTQGRYSGYMTIKKHLGSVSQSADGSAVANMSGWSNDCKLSGIAYLYITLKKNQDIYPNGVPNFSAIVEGKKIYDPRTDSNKFTTNIALMCSDFITNNEYGFGALDDDIDMVNVAAQANICDEIVDTEFEETELKSVSSSVITLKGDMLKYQYGDRVQITTTGTAPGGTSTGTNYYVIPHQVKDTPRLMLATSLANALDKINITITDAGTGTVNIRKTGEPRYHGGGVIDTEDNLSNTLSDLAVSMAGRVVNIGGYWTLVAGAWRTPTVDFAAGDIVSDGISFKSSASMSDSYNEVKGTFISPLNFYQSSDYPSAVYQEFIDQDNGIKSTKDIALPFTQRPTTAQRIAKIELFRGRQDIVVRSSFTTKAMQVQPADVVTLTLDHLGWDEKEFEITEFSFDTNDGALLCRMTLRETAGAIYDWTSGEAIDFDPAPNTNLPDPFTVQVPTGVSFNSRAIDTRDGDVLYKLQLQWDHHPDAFVTSYGDFEIQFKKSDDADWLPSFFVDGDQIKADVVSSSVGIEYDLRIRARNNLGVRSNWVTITNASVGASGGVGTTEDWRTFSDLVTTTDDWGLFSDTVTTTKDWGYFT